MCSRCARYKKHIPLRLTGAKINNAQSKHLARGNCRVGVNSSRSRISKISTISKMTVTMRVNVFLILKIVKIVKILLIS